MLSTRKIAYGIGVAMAAQATVDEALDEECLEEMALDVTLDDGALDLLALDVVALGSVAVNKVSVSPSCSGSGSLGFGCDSSGIGLPKGPMANGGKSHDGGKLNSVPQPKRDLNRDRIPDPHPFLLGSVGFPPSPGSIRPRCLPPQTEQP